MDLLKKSKKNERNYRHGLIKKQKKIERKDEGNIQKKLKGTIDVDLLKKIQKIFSTTYRREFIKKIYFLRTKNRGFIKKSIFVKKIFF